MTVAELYKSCPQDKKVVIGDFYAVPLKWASPDSGSGSGPHWIILITSTGGHDNSGIYGEIDFKTGRLLSTLYGSVENHFHAWAETKEEHIVVLKGLIKQLTELI